MPSTTSNRLWTDLEIAKLSSSDIARLNYHEMQSLITSPRCSVAGGNALQVSESDVLVRRVYALREQCRRRLADA